MAHASDPTLLVLHALRLKGFAEAPVVAERTCLDVAEVEKRLDSMATDGLVSHRQGRLSGWSLTADGRAAHAAHVADDVATAGCVATVDGAYRRFLEINADLLGVCTDWQMKVVGGEQMLNDHTDAAYDAEVIGRLGGVDDAVQPLCAVVAAELSRFAGYGPRLADARAKLEAGDCDWFTKPLVDSYHTVWFELHEDFLVTLGIERSAEEA